MPFTDNITSAPYNAVADGHWVQDTFSITTNVLSCPNAVFTTAVAAQSIVVGQAGGAAPGGGSPLLTTISSVAGDKKSVTLGASAGQALSSEPNVIVAWGTNNYTAFDNFRTARAGDTGTLTIPASGTGIYLVSNGNAGGLFAKVTNVTVNMTGATIAGATFQLGSGGQSASTSDFARVASVNAGATSVTCITHAEAARFTVGKYALMTGISIQFSGYPTNHQRFEYVLITSVNSTTGVVQFTPGLANSYLSTWPLYNSSGSALDNGPATLYAWGTDNAGGEFDHTLVVNGGTFAHHAQFALTGRSLTINDATFPGLYGPFPTSSGAVALNRCTCSQGTMEVDKYNSNFSMTDCSWGGVTVQSTSTSLLTLDNTDITNTLLGIPYNTVIRNGCSVGTLVCGVQYGIAQQLGIADSNITNFGDVTAHSSGHVIKGGNDLTSTGVNVDFSMAGGVITIPSTWYSFGNIMQWAVPGLSLFFVDPNFGTLGRFTILDVTQDASNVYVRTDWNSNAGRFPPSTYLTGILWMWAHPGAVATVSNTTGCPELVDLSRSPVGTPLHSYSKRIYDNTTGTGRYFQLWGKIKYIKVTVTQLATQSGTVALTLGNTCVKASTFAGTSFAPVINMKAGLNAPRILDCRNASSTGTWTGAQSGDTLPDITEAIWSCSNFRVSMTTPLAGPGLVEVEYITEQFDAPAPTTFVGFVAYMG